MAVQAGAGNGHSTTAAVRFIVLLLCLITQINRSEGQRIPGCLVYNADGSQCLECVEPNYKARGGKCVCGTGFYRDGIFCRPDRCYNRCGETNIVVGRRICSCDYWCSYKGDCCAGTPSKNQLCPTMRPSVDKAEITDCESDVSVGSASVKPSLNYRPGMCWCDSLCKAAGDCCPLGRKKAAGRPRQDEQASASLAASTPAAAGNQAEDVPASPGSTQASDTLLQQGIKEADAAAALARAQGIEPHDCRSVRVPSQQQPKVRRPGQPAPEAVVMSDADAEAIFLNEREAETVMQNCQAADTGRPLDPIIVPLHWTAARVCNRTASNKKQCFGANYTKADVRRQLTILNAIYARLGIQFSWDGQIHRAEAKQDWMIDVGYNEFDWVCKQERFGDASAINVITSPTHMSGDAVGATPMPTIFVRRSFPLPRACDWVFIYEKTLPGLGGRSLVDGQLVDGGHVLAHEIGHAMMLQHTWHELGGPSITDQCAASVSLDPLDIVLFKSDGVRDTPPQSLNSTDRKDILRFINCDPETMAYTNTTENAQQSCNSRHGFPRGDGFLNNHNNLMSYGDKSCLKTLTPGQGARARCGYKCIRLGQCESTRN